MTRWAHPVPARDDGSLAPEAVESWRERGFALIDGVLPHEPLERLRSHALATFPEPGSAEAQATADFGSAFVFPSQEASFNEVTLHSRLLGAVSQLLDTAVDQLRLTQSNLWPKYGRTEKSAGRYDNQDQRIHIDYPNHTLTHPAPWDRPEAVEMIVYLSDVEECGGPTAVVPRDSASDPAYRWPIVDSPGIGDLRYVNDRESAETYFAEHRPELAAWRQELYERERWARFRFGSVLFYRHDTWHRGTPMVPGTIRLAHNITYRRAECEWISTLHEGWAWKMYRPDHFMERLIATASLDQRAVLGFPPPGSPYWCEETLAAVTARYGAWGFDPAPYADALG